MKRYLPLLLIVLAACFVQPARAQNHAEIGVYGDYFRLNETKTNFGGLGGRLSVNANPYLQLEAEVSYDFQQGVTEGFTNTGTGSVTLQRTNTRILHGLFGPKLQTTGPVRLFVTAKGGFVNFRLDQRPATFATFASSIDNLRADDLTGVFYSGGGAEAFLGPLGFRIDVGDEMYFTSGTHHNLRVEFGPVIRF